MPILRDFSSMPSLKTDHSYSLSSASFITALPSNDTVTYTGKKPLLTNRSVRHISISLFLTTFVSIFSIPAFHSKGSRFNAYLSLGFAIFLNS
jgi:hypothetical protein